LSSLESKAKTPEEIMRSAKMPHGFKEKWIPLKEAQKEISALKIEFEKNNAFTHNKILEFVCNMKEECADISNMVDYLFEKLTFFQSLNRQQSVGKNTMESKQK